MPKCPNWHFGFFFIFAQKWLTFCMWPNIIKAWSLRCCGCPLRVVGWGGWGQYGLIAAAWSAFSCWRPTSYHKVWNNNVKWTRLLSTHHVETYSTKISVLKFSGWFVFDFQELMYAKSITFRSGIVWLLVPRYWVANSITVRWPSSLKWDENSTGQGSNSKAHVEFFAWRRQVVVNACRGWQAWVSDQVQQFTKFGFGIAKSTSMRKSKTEKRKVECPQDKLKWRTFVWILYKKPNDQIYVVGQLNSTQVYTFVSQNQYFFHHLWLETKKIGALLPFVRISRPDWPVCWL